MGNGNTDSKQQEEKSFAIEAKGLCDGMSFTMAESYKMLRTKLALTMPRGEMTDCRIIGVTSALRGEGKTFTSINLAYTIAEAEKRVCLIEADMRIPTLAKRLSLNEKPGLSSVLTGQTSGAEITQKYKSEKGVEFDVIVAGDIPPMPSELLESKYMKMIVNILSKHYNYIIIDLPPVTVVTDAISVSPIVDGMVLVVRRNYCDRISLRNTMNQFNLAKVKLLGVVYNGTDGPETHAGYYKKNGKKYYRSTYYAKDAD
ncbi:MAG: CpsD/CapB family tyrosine-protein kinase [Clostridiales bacterium]|nr:CpsD/CapB family tyrosine-protein kinase [Clostridiales bacterium]